MATNADFFMTYSPLVEALRGIYGWGNSPGVSYVEYLTDMLNPEVWADEIILTVMSIMWEVPITLVYGDTLREWKVRHHLPLKEAEICLLYTGDRHYSPIGKPIPFFDRARSCTPE